MDYFGYTVEVYEYYTCKLYIEVPFHVYMSLSYFPSQKQHMIFVWHNGNLLAYNNEFPRVVRKGNKSMMGEVINMYV